MGYTYTHPDWYFMGYNYRGMSFQRGPFTASQMQAFLRAGEINGGTLIRQGDKSQWCPLRDVQIFAAVAQTAEAKRTISRFRRKYGAGVLVIVLIACVVIYTREQSPHYQYQFKPSNPDGYTLSQESLTREAIITLSNHARALNGLPPLSANPLLNAIAESRARDMLEKQYFAHVSPTGQQASDIAQSVGYPYKIIAENIGSGTFYTNQKVIDNWMQSPGHRRNMLSPEVAEIGAAVLKGRMNGNETYITVQIFGLQSPSVSQQTCVAPQKSLLDDIERMNAEIASLNAQLNRLKQDLDSENEAIETDRRYTYGDPQKIHNLNVKIMTHNEKSNWHNQIVVNVKAKAATLNSMVNEYTRMLQAYNDCRAVK
jgi:uncharacterized protein YkwD